VLVLVGLPRLLTGSILAHEAMHVWVKLTPTFPYHLPLATEEGICQYVAMRFLEHERSRNNSIENRAGNESSHRSNSSMKSSKAARLEAFFRFQIETDPTPTYGDGYRACAKACADLGSFEIVLEHIREFKAFPST
jgi:hypothetical protein